METPARRSEWVRVSRYQPELLAEDLALLRELRHDLEVLRMHRVPVVARSRGRLRTVRVAKLLELVGLG